MEVYESIRNWVLNKARKVFPQVPPEVAQHYHGKLSQLYLLLAASAFAFSVYKYNKEKKLNLTREMTLEEADQYAFEFADELKKTTTSPFDGNFSIATVNKAEDFKKFKKLLDEREKLKVRLSYPEKSEEVDLTKSK